MPIYLCNPGEGENEPWRHGIQVYTTPFDLGNPNNNNSRQQQHLSSSVLGSSSRDLVAAATLPTTTTATATATATSGGSSRSNDSIAGGTTDQQQHQGRQQQQQNPLNQALSIRRGQRLEALDLAGQSSENNSDYDSQNIRGGTGGDGTSSSIHDGGVSRSSSTSAANLHHQHHQQHGVMMNHPIRRVRHAEVVLVDDVCIAHSRYWLRLRWPGSKGGFAGYIAMARVSDSENPATRIDSLRVDFSKIRFPSGSSEERGMMEEADADDPARDDVMVSTPPSEPFDSSECLTCARTGLKFQTSSALKLLAMYDDGIMPRVTMAPFPTEQIFCRICREGLHEDADTEQPNAATEDAEIPTTTAAPQIDSNDAEDEEDDGYSEEPTTIQTSEPYQTVGPILPHPTYNSNPDALHNPMLAPCECAGSMAFVHYLCVEQWRCRSRHPDAHKGLNCETCGKPYALPPPSERHGSDAQSLEQEDWLDAMPPHVMQALRQPHIWWQLGAAIVRRRWLRPLAPVFMSPVVALYCRARRLLKKRGVARRRWACSLCRRRARWKCVRCLRSYYCSRQCQNVSWHIIHKHVCYKPVRFWWSVVVYGIIALLVFPGILRDPLMYYIGGCLIPVSFVVMGVLGGGLATTIKRLTGIDVRGRLLELSVVVCTGWLCAVTWALVKGFFGNTGACHGTFGPYTLSTDILPNTISILRLFRWAILKPAEQMYLFWDAIALQFHWLRFAFCIRAENRQGCFEHLPFANANFILKEDGGEKCASDLLAVIVLYLLAGGVFAGSSLLKHHERQRRRRQQQQRHERPVAHAHQD